MENQYMSEESDEWVEIQSPSSSKNLNSVIIIRDDDFFTDSTVLPPSNHLGLRVSSSNENHQLSEVQQQQRFSSSSSSSSLSSGGTDANEEVEVEKIKDKSVSRINVGLGFLRYKIVEVASRMKNYAVSKARILWLVISVTTGLGTLLFVYLLYSRVQRRRRQVKLENKQQQQQQQQNLIHLIQEKDQKITELLFQIAQLNDVLLQRRRVPILQID